MSKKRKRGGRGRKERSNSCEQRMRRGMHNENEERKVRRRMMGA